jgi:hypothetical protein
MDGVLISFKVRESNIVPTQAQTNCPVFLQMSLLNCRWK